MHVIESDKSAKNNNFPQWIMQNYSLYESVKVNSTIKRLRGIENKLIQKSIIQFSQDYRVTF